MVRWVAALAVVLFAPVARAEFDPVGDDGWPKGETTATLRGLPRCEGPLRGEPGAGIPCRPRIAPGGAPIAYSMDWTTGLALGDGTSGGTQAWGHELLVAVTRNIQLGGRYELMGTGLDDRMATTVIGHNLFGLARYRWFTDEVDRTAWTLGAGVGWQARGDGGEPIARVSVGRDFGMFISQRSALTSAFELAYERSLDDAAQHHVVGSLRVGFELGIREPRNIGEPAHSDPHLTSVHVGVLAMPGASFGFDANIGFGHRRLGWENSVGYLFGTTGEGKLTGLDGAQWSVRTGPRLRWWQVAYAQAQVGAAWVAADSSDRVPDAHVEALWHAEAGVSLGCAEAGIWIQRNFEGDRTNGGLLFRIGRGGNGWCGGGRSPDPHFATEYIPPPPVVEKVVEEKIVVEEKVVEEKVVVVTPPPVIAVEPIVIELELGVGMIARLPVERMRGARVAVEIIGAPYLLGGAEVQLRQLLGGAGIRVDAWARVAASGGLRVRFTIVPR